jgi:hypothetical protein
MNRMIESERTNPSAILSRIPGGLMTLAVAMLALSGCANLEAPQTGEFADSMAASETVAMDRQHPTIESAALHALSEAWDGTRSWNREKMRVGSIVQTEGTYAWLAPESAESTSRPVARVKLVPEHAATYIVHPRTHSLDVADANEKITKREKSLVDHADPLHRPIFVLTRSGRLLMYAHGEAVVELASMRNRDAWSAASVEESETAVAKRD